MRKQYYYLILIVLLISMIAQSCNIHKPKGFSYNYNKGVDTGIESLIDIDGYYLMQRECDSTYYSAFVFYPDGLFCIVTGTDLAEASKCLYNDTKTTLCQNLSWGLYSLNNGTIKTETLRQEGMAFCVIYRDYIVLPDRSLVNISDYVDSQSTTIGYMKNYPSFRKNACVSPSKFISIPQTKRNPSFCPYINKKWFLEQ